MVSQVTRRVWVVASALCGRLHAAAPLLLIAGLWAGSAELYATVMEASHGGESVGLAFVVGVNSVISAWLFFNLLQFARELKQLRLPEHRSLLIGALAFILCLTFVAPCALVLSVHGGVHDLIVIIVGSCVGIAGALLSHYRGAVTSPGHRHGVQDPVGTAAAARAATRALRTALGAPYAPASWRMRSLELALLAVVLAGGPLLVCLTGSSLSPRSFSRLLHTVELLGLFVAMGLCWVWPLSRALALFDLERGALNELALLPALGSGRRQRRRLYRVILGIPTAGLVGLLIIAMSAAWLQGLPDSVYPRLALQFLLLPLITLPILLGYLQPKPIWRLGGIAVLLLSPTWTFTLLIWTWSSDMLAVQLLRWMGMAVLLGIAVIIGQMLYLLHKLALRPHPFVDVSS